MGNEQKIVDKILADAHAEAEAVLAEAKKEADAIVAEAEDRSEKEMASLLKLAEAEAAKAAAKEISGADMQAKKSVLAKKQEILTGVINEAIEGLQALSGGEYIKTVVSMVENAETGEEIIISSKEREALSAVLAEKGYTVSNEIRDIGGGFIVKKGEIEYNYSFDSIISVEREAVEQAAAKILFS